MGEDLNFITPCKKNSIITIRPAQILSNSVYARSQPKQFASFFFFHRVSFGAGLI